MPGPRIPARPCWRNGGNINNGGRTYKQSPSVRGRHPEKFQNDLNALKRNVSVYNAFAAYPAPLVENPDDPAAWHTEAERDRVCAAELNLRDRLEAAGLHRSLPLPREQELYMCMADRGSMITVLPGGEIGLCQYYHSSGFIGSLDGPALTQQELCSGRVLREEIPACADCPIYPGCIPLKLCPNQICYPQRRQFREEIKKRSMLMEWRQYQLRRTNA